MLGVVRALLALPMFAGFAPFSNLIYALVVLLIVLIVVSLFFGGSFGTFGPGPSLRLRS